MYFKYFISKCTNYIYNTYVTGLAKRGLPQTSNLPTLTIDNFRLERAVALNLGSGDFFAAELST